MRATDAERTEMAQAIRGIDMSDEPLDSARLLMEISRAVGTFEPWEGKPPHALPPYEWHVERCRRLQDRLADLIEPEEWTCRVVSSRYEEEEGCYILLTELSCGHTVQGFCTPRYCEDCGAKVVQDDGD